MGKAGGHGLAWEEEVVNSEGDNEWVTVTLLRGGKEIIYGSLRGLWKDKSFPRDFMEDKPMGNGLVDASFHSF